MILGKQMFQLSLLDFDIKNIFAQILTFENEQIADYLSDGRKQHIFHLITSGKRTYYINGKSFELSTNQVLFIPHGTMYKTQAHETNGKKCTGIGIIFDAVLEDGSYVSLPQMVYHRPCDTKGKELFEKISATYNDYPVKLTKLKSLMLELISHLAHENDNQMKEILKPALDYFSITYKENLPIQSYAEKCNLSESYFRKIFRETIGMSPINYRNELRFAEAERLYLLYRNIGRVAEEVGFCDEVFFTKLYKKRFGTSIKNIAKLV